MRHHQDEFQKECIRLVKDVQYFDVLRGDKTTAGNGLEIIFLFLTNSL